MFSKGVLEYLTGRILRQEAPACRRLGESWEVPQVFFLMCAAPESGPQRWKSTGHLQQQSRGDSGRRTAGQPHFHGSFPPSLLAPSPEMGGRDQVSRGVGDGASSPLKEWLLQPVRGGQHFCTQWCHLFIVIFNFKSDL